MKKVKDLFKHFEDRIDLVVNRITELFDTAVGEEKQLKDFIENMLSREVKDNQLVVSILTYNVHKPNYYVDAVLIEPGKIAYRSVDYADWDEILGAYFVTEAPLVDTLAIIIFLMTLISYNEEERNKQIAILKEM